MNSVKDAAPVIEARNLNVTFHQDRKSAHIVKDVTSSASRARASP